jgi:ribosomal protein L29
VSEDLEVDAVEERRGLRREIVETKKKLLSLRLRKNGGELKDMSIFKKERKNIARLFTKLNRRECKDGSK